MPTSVTYQDLPPDLLDPLLAGAISLTEASELFDLALMSPEEKVEIPPHLDQAVQRLMLFRMSVWYPVQ